MKSPCRCKQCSLQTTKMASTSLASKGVKRKDTTEENENKMDDIKISFQKEWLMKYAWLKHEDREMYCSVCKAFKKKNTLTSGSTNFRTSTLVRHIESRDHRGSLIKKSFSKEDQSLIAALRTVYFTAKQDIASVKYPHFIDFLVMQGCSSLNAITTGGAASVSYRSHGIVSEMQESLATVIRDDIDKMPNDSDFISIHSFV